MGPARATVGLISDVVDHGFALRPVGAGVEGVWDVVSDKSWFTKGRHVHPPVWVNDSAHKLPDLSKRKTIELGVDTCYPGGFWVRIDGLDVLGEVKGFLLSEIFHESVVGAELDVLAGLLRLSQVDQLGLVHEVGDSRLKLGELGVDSIKFSLFAGGGEVEDLLAKLANVVVLREELVDSAGVGDGEESCR